MTKAQLETIIDLIANETAAGGNTKTRIASAFSGVWSRFFSENANEYSFDEPLEIGFYNPAPNPADPPVFSGLRFFYDDTDDFVTIQFVKRNTIFFFISDEEGNYLKEFAYSELRDIYDDGQSEIVSRRALGQEIVFSDTLNLPSVIYSRLKRYKILDTAIPNTGQISLQYTHYNSFAFAKKTKTSGDTFEIYFKSKNNTSVRFAAFNGDSYTQDIAINANTHYKLNIYLYDALGAGVNTPKLFWKIEELTEGLEN